MSIPDRDLTDAMSRAEAERRDAEWVAAMSRRLSRDLAPAPSTPRRLWFAAGLVFGIAAVAAGSAIMAAFGG